MICSCLLIFFEIVFKVKIFVKTNVLVNAVMTSIIIEDKSLKYAPLSVFRVIATGNKHKEEARVCLDGPIFLLVLQQHLLY